MLPSRSAATVSQKPGLGYPSRRESNRRRAIADPPQENGREGEEEQQLQSEQLADRVSMGGHEYADRLFSGRQQNH